jgi:hypothetical protein
VEQLVFPVLRVPDSQIAVEWVVAAFEVNKKRSPGVWAEFLADSQRAAEDPRFDCDRGLDKRRSYKN